MAFWLRCTTSEMRTAALDSDSGLERSQSLINCIGVSVRNGLPARGCIDRSNPKISRKVSNRNVSIRANYNNVCFPRSGTQLWIRAYERMVDQAKNASGRMNDCDSGNESPDSPQIATTDDKPAKAELLHDIETTAKCRFIASARLELHEAYSEWTVALMTCCVIGLTLFDGLEMFMAEAKKPVDFLQVFCSVVILAFSIILAKSGFSLRAYRHHECGKELSKLKNKVQLVDDKNTNALASAGVKYASILSKHDNHAYLDYLCMKWQRPDDYNDELHWWFWVCYCARTVWEYWMYFIFFAVAIGGLSFVFMTYRA